MAVFRHLAFIIGTVGFLSLLLLILAPSMKTDSSAGNLVVSCWCPGGFTHNQGVFTDKVCKKHLLSDKNNTYKVPESPNPTFEPTKDFINRKDEDVFDKSGDNVNMAILVIIEILILSAFYTVASTIPQEFGRCRIGQIIVQVTCALLYLLASFIPFLFTEASADVTEVQTHTVNGEFLCDLKTLRLGNMHPYTIHCAYEDSRSDSLTLGRSNNKPLAILHAAVSGVVAILIMGALANLLRGKRKNGHEQLE